MFNEFKEMVGSKMADIYQLMKALRHANFHSPQIIMSEPVLISFYEIVDNVNMNKCFMMIATR